MLLAILNNAKAVWLIASHQLEEHSRFALLFGVFRSL